MGKNTRPLRETFKLLALVFLFLGGCATTLTDEERAVREWKRGVDMENWLICENIYAYHGKATMHVDHVHRNNNSVSPVMIKQDLSVNDCRKILGDYYMEY